MLKDIGLLLLALVLISMVLWDIFETIILPRRVTRGWRLARIFYKYSWLPWMNLARLMREGKRKDSFLALFGPLSLLLIMAMWAFGLVIGFALVHYAIGSQLNSPDGPPSFLTDLYLSGTTFFTLGLGDVTPTTSAARVITVVESGIGFGMLAIVISYLPVLYGSFSQREVNISLMDAHAGSPPSAGELLRRQFPSRNGETLRQYFKDWERWASELMESHLSYPVLCFFRSQHANQSWLAALTTILDSTAFVMAYAEGELRWQAEMTFAISRHAVRDLAQVLRVAMPDHEIDRLSAAQHQHLCRTLSDAGIALNPQGAGELKRLQKLYEPYLIGIAARLMMIIPPWTIEEPTDNWRPRKSDE